MKVHFCCSLLVLFQTVNSLNILCIFPYQGKSHFFVFRNLIKELTNKGHNVTVISHFPEDNAVENHHDISLAGSLKIVEDELPVHRNYLTVMMTGWFLTSTARDNCKVMLENKEVQRLVKDNSKFDVAIVEQFNSDCGLGLAYKLGAPVVGITSHVLMPWHYKRLGIPNNPAYVSFHFLEGGTKPILYQRIERALFDIYFKIMYAIVSQRDNEDCLKKHFGDMPNLETLSSEMKFVLLYHHFILTGSQLFPSNIVEVGGFHVQEAKPLKGKLKEFVDGAEHGVIYICFGSVVKSSTMPDDKLQAVLGAIAELPQRFIWKWEDATLLKDQKNLFISSWLPQADILAHPKTVAFFSHAGMLGTTEAIHFGVPIVAMPILGDQPANAAAIEESGLGVAIQVQDLTKENLLAAFKKVLDPKFRLKVKEISNAWHDRPMKPLDTAVYWTEFAARHPNMTFRAAAADVPLYQYLNLDIILVLATTVMVATWLSLCICCGCFRNKNLSDEKDKKSLKKE